jgi:hypothetical protein
MNLIIYAGFLTFKIKINQQCSSFSSFFFDCFPLYISLKQLERINYAYNGVFVVFFAKSYFRKLYLYKMKATLAFFFALLVARWEFLIFVFLFLYILERERNHSLLLLTTPLLPKIFFPTNNQNSKGQICACVSFIIL